jgi:hypothetical protein
MQQNKDLSSLTTLRLRFGKLENLSNDPKCDVVRRASGTSMRAMIMSTVQASHTSRAIKNVMRSCMGNLFAKGVAEMRRAKARERRVNQPRTEGTKGPRKLRLPPSVLQSLYAGKYLI